MKGPDSTASGSPLLNRFLLDAFDASPVAIVVTAFDGRLLYCNNEFTRKTGIERGELSEHWAERLYVYPEQRAVLVDRFRREGAFRDAEVAYHLPDGDVWWGVSSWAPIEYDGASAILSWHYDITARKRIETELVAAKSEAERALTAMRAAQESLVQAEAMASLGELVAGVAHDVSTPLGIGVTAASHLADHVARLHEGFEAGRLRKADMADFLNAATESVKLLVANLVRADELIQSFKQVAVDRTSGARRGFDLKTYIDEVLFSLRPRLKRGGVAVVVKCPEDVHMDSFPGALSQVITNLVINALVHAYGDHPGTGVLRIDVQLGGEDAVLLSIADDGVGIKPDNLIHVFEPFFTTRRGAGGSGLGLHIVHETVTRTLGGTVEVASTVGKGTRFTLVLPRVAPGDPSVPA